MITENPHWTKERWLIERNNSIKCLEETREFVDKNIDIGKEHIDTSTVEGFNEATEKKKIFNKVIIKKSYIFKLEQRIKDINQLLETL